jgi:hypothetical protein
MKPHKLSRTDARRIAVRAQLLDKARPATLDEVLDGLTMLQVDQTAAVAPSADLVIWSRLGSRYSPQELTDARTDHSVIELRSMIRPSKDLALYRADMDEWPGTGTVSGWLRAEQRWLSANDGCRRDILARLDEAGPLSSRELPDTCVQPWKSSGWNNNRNVTLMLELMEKTGDVAVAGRDRAGRLWDLTDRVYPPGPTLPAAQARQLRGERRLRALGIARARGQECPVEPWDVGDAGEPAVIEGVRGEWRVDPAALGRRFAGRAALLSPLDRLVHDRKRMAELFEFDYQLEMFKPAAKRRWGYYALPILYGDCLVGKVDARADRKAGVLVVNAIHEDEPFTKTMTAAVEREIKDLARWLRLAVN